MKGKKMSDEYVNSFISSLILDDDVEEFENFTAKTRGGLCHICFQVDCGKLLWNEVEYEDEDDYDEEGTLVNGGTVQIILKENPSDFLALDSSDENAHEFISCFFPAGSDITQVYPDRNIFFVNGLVYNFDTMKCGDNHIHFEFCR